MITEIKQETLDSIKGKPPIFLHIPKSGGTFLKITARNHGFDINSVPGKMGHWSVNTSGGHPWGKIHNWPSLSNQYFFCTVVRNPYDLLVSWYHHGRNGSGWGFTAQGINTFDEFFDKFVQNELCVKAFCLNMYGQLFDEHGVYVPSVTIRYESLNEGVETTLRACGIVKPDQEIKFAEVNASVRRKERHYKEFYNERTIKLFEEKCKDIFEQFGYTYDGPTDDYPIIIPDVKKLAP